MLQCVANEPADSLNKENCTWVLQCVAVRYSSRSELQCVADAAADSVREGNRTCVHVLKE